MRTFEFTELVAQLGYTQYGAFFCGVTDRWPVTLYSASYGRFSVPVSLKECKDKLPAAKQEIKALGGKLLTSGNNGGCLVIRFPKSKGLQGSLYTFVHHSLGALTRLGIHPLDCCPVCRNGNCDVASFLQGSFRGTHRHCLQGKADAAATAAEENLQSGSYLTGILGAIIGMLVGTLPSLLTILFADSIYALLFALIPIGAYFGYKLFRGRMNKFALLVSILAAVFGVFLLNFELMIYYLINDYYFTFKEALGFLLEELAYGEYWLSIARDSLLEFFFAALGVLFAWRLISRTADSNAAEAQAALRRAVPIYDQTELCELEENDESLQEDHLL